MRALTTQKKKIWIGPPKNLKATITLSMSGLFVLYNVESTGLYTVIFEFPTFTGEIITLCVFEVFGKNARRKDTSRKTRWYLTVKDDLRCSGYLKAINRSMDKTHN
jgi:hypothetical protein